MRGKVRGINAYVGARVREMRKRRRMSLRTVGNLLDVSPQQVSRLESGRQRLSAEQLHKLACGFQAPVSWFFHGYEPSSAEKEWLRLAVGKLRLQDVTDEGDDQLEIVVAGWKALKTSAQRKAVVSLLDAFASGEVQRRV